MRMMTSDEALARAAASGDRDAFATLLTRHYDRMFRLAFRLTGRAGAAEDLVKDICAALPAKFASFRGDAKFTTWLYRVIFNAAEDVGSDAVRNGPLRYKTPGEADSRLIEQPSCRAQVRFPTMCVSRQRLPVSASCCAAARIWAAGPTMTPSRWPARARVTIRSDTAPRPSP